VLGGGVGYGAAHVLTEDPGTGASKEIKDTQTSAIDANNMKDTESTKQLTLLNKNIETLVASSDANLMVNGKIASLTDNNSRYLRGTAFGSA
jgi:urocanate hydratase